MTKVHQAARFGQKFIDYKIGFAGAVVMGGIVFAINYYSTHQMVGSITASLKQGAYTFIFGGTLMKTCEYIATTVKSKTMAIVLSVVIPSVFTLILTFTMHNLKGTPKPLESTIPTTIIIPATIIWGFRKRKQMEMQLQ